MRGRKPKSPEQRERDGSKSRPTHEENPPEYEHARPDCPEHLDAAARAEWDRLADRLYEAGTLTHEARGTMVAYCVAWSLATDAAIHLEETGPVLVSETGRQMRSPYFDIWNAASKLQNSLAAELGITPSSRGRVQAVTVKKKDPKERFFKVVG